MALDFSRPKAEGFIRMADEKRLKVRYMFKGTPYGIVATDLASVRTTMITVAQKLSDLTGLAIEEISYEIEWEHPDPRPVAPLENDGKWKFMIATQTENGFNTVIDIPAPLAPIMTPDAKRLNTTNPQLLAYINTFNNSGNPNTGFATGSFYEFVEADSSGNTPILGHQKVVTPKQSK